MRRRWLTAILVLTLLASSWAAFGAWGVAGAIYLLALLAAIGGWRAGREGAGTALLFLVLLPFFLLVLFLPAIQAPRSGRRITCANNLKQIAIAMLEYEKANGCLPPAYLCDKDGKPMHSWRVLILPYLDYTPLYKEYNFAEPWDGPNNRKLVKYTPRDYTCPSALASETNRAPLTSYVVVTGPDTAFPGCQSRQLSEIEDPANTVLVVEVANSDISWMEPRDPSIDELAAGPSGHSEPLTSAHGGRDYWSDAIRPLAGNVVCADGSTHFLGGSISPDDAETMLSIRTSEKPTIDKLAGRVGHGPPPPAGLRWDRVVGLPAFCLSLLSLFVLALTHRRRDARPDEPWALN